MLCWNPWKSNTFLSVLNRVSIRIITFALQYVVTIRLRLVMSKELVEWYVAAARRSSINMIISRVSNGRRRPTERLPKPRDMLKRPWTSAHLPLWHPRASSQAKPLHLLSPASAALASFVLKMIFDCGYALARRHRHQQVDSPPCRICR